MYKRPLDLDKMDLAIIALVQYRNLNKAAAAIGVHPVTVWRWLKLPHFRQQLHHAQAQVYSAAIAHLQRAATFAADALVAMLKDETTPSSSRIKVAEYILEQGRKTFALEEIEVEEFDLTPDPLEIGRSTHNGSETSSTPVRDEAD